MVSGVRARVSDLAERRPLVLLSLAALVAAGAAAASPLGQPERTAVAGAVQEAVAAASAKGDPGSVPLERVWEGRDVDGDGKADFANPTGQEARGHDAYGAGAFGARRDGGSRRHEGVDFVARAGQPVAAPISGFVTKIGFAYADDPSLRFVEVTNPALRYAARVFYVNPTVQVGDAVQVGRPIGRARSLQRKYPGGMTDHVHLEIIDQRSGRIDATKVIVAQYAPAADSAFAAD